MHISKHNTGGFGDEFFRGESTLAAQEEAKKQRDKEEKMKNQKALEAELDEQGVIETPEKRRKIGDVSDLEGSEEDSEDEELDAKATARLQKLKLSLMQKITKDLSDTIPEVQAKLAQAAEAAQLARSSPVDTGLETDTLARKSYTEALENRAKLGRAWLSEESDGSSSRVQLTDEPWADLETKKKVLTVLKEFTTATGTTTVFTEEKFKVPY